MKRVLALTLTAVASVILVFVGLALVSDRTIQAAGVVGNDTLGSCTETALTTALTGGGLVQFNCGLAPAVITITVPGGLSPATTPTTVDGPDINSGEIVTLTGADNTRIFNLASTSRLTLTNLILTNGASGSGFGGAIYNAGILILDNVTVQQSHTGGGFNAGGGIRNDNGTVTLLNSRVLSNTSPYGGGVDSVGALTVVNSVIAGNTATTNNGGGLEVGGTATISGSTIYTNTAFQFGGGIVTTSGSRVTIRDTQVLSNALISGSGNVGGGGILNHGALTLTNALVQGNTVSETAGVGGGILNDNGTLSADNVTFRRNSALNAGGLFSNSPSCSLTDVVFDSNSASQSGGGMYSFSSGLIVPTLSRVSFIGNDAATGGGLYSIGRTALTGVEFRGNRAGQGGAWKLFGSVSNASNLVFTGNNAAYGGAIQIDRFLGSSEVNLTGATINGNSADVDGGGIYSAFSSSPYITVNLTNVTLSGNTATGSVGAIYNGSNSVFTLTNVTLAGNGATAGGGIFNTAGYTVTLKNSVVADSPSGGNCGGAPLTADKSDKFSLSSDNTCVLNTTNGSGNNVNPRLGPLFYNGGPFVGAGAGQPMLTHLPLAGSPAIDGVLGADFLPFDQRGFGRPVGAGADIGAVEAGILWARGYLPLLLQNVPPF